MNDLSDKDLFEMLDGLIDKLDSLLTESEGTTK